MGESSTAGKIVPAAVGGPARRLARWILGPALRRYKALIGRLDALEQTIDDMNRRMDELSDQARAGAAMGWDHVAMARRLAALEDRAEALQRWADEPRPPGVRREAEAA